MQQPLNTPSFCSFQALTSHTCQCYTRFFPASFFSLEPPSILMIAGVIWKIYQQISACMSMSYYFFGKIGNHVPKPQPKNYKKQLNKSATGQLGYGGMASYNSGVCQQPQTLTYKRVSQHYRQPCTEVSVLNHPTNRIMHLNEVVHHNRNQTSIFKKSENEPQILNFTLGNIAADNM